MSKKIIKLAKEIDLRKSIIIKHTMLLGNQLINSFNGSLINRTKKTELE